MSADYYHNYFPESTGIAVSERKDEVTVLYPEDVEEFMYYMPTPKSPHGVDLDPSGELIVAGGKLAKVIHVHSFSRIFDSNENRHVEDETSSLSASNYAST